MSSIALHGRRRTDRRLTAVAIGAAQSVLTRLDAVAGGRLLMASTGAVAVAAAPLLQPAGNDWTVLLGISGAMAALLAISFLPDWTRLPGRATLGFPLSVFAALAALGNTAPHLASALTGLLAGAYVYTGLTQRAGSSALIVPFGSAAFVVMTGGLSHAVAIRMLINAMVGTLIVEILAAFMRQQRRLAHRLERAAMCDALTGLPNRRDLETRLPTARPGDTLVLCDLDHFKHLNDTLGHRAGDLALADFGALLRRQLREDDYCARYGGEEFVLVLPDTDAQAALVLLRRLHTAWLQLTVRTTFSAGVATCRAGRTPAATLAAADAALYQAKADGRNTDRLERVSAAA